MNVCRGLTVALLLAACGGPPADDEVPVDSVELSMDSIESLIELEAELPPMPDAPEAGVGRLAVHSVGDLELEHRWQAAAEHCEAAGVLLLLARTDEMGASLRIDMASGDSATVTYTIAASDTTGGPTPLTAQFGLQRFASQTLEAWRATDGVVDLTRFDGAVVAGSLAVTLTRTTNRLQSRLAGTFSAVPVRASDAQWCLDFLPPPDTSTAPDTTVTSAAP